MHTHKSNQAGAGGILYSTTLRLTHGVESTCQPGCSFAEEPDAGKGHCAVGGAAAKPGATAAGMPAEIGVRLPALSLGARCDCSNEHSKQCKNSTLVNLKKCSALLGTMR
jgi:hypothetical protein